MFFSKGTEIFFSEKMKKSHFKENGQVSIFVSFEEMIDLWKNYSDIKKIPGT